MTTPERTRLLVATSNPGKLAEFRSLLSPSLELLTLTDLGIEAPEETGATFADNATLKAENAVKQAGMIAIADDSGLEIDVLDGAPGIYSARYAGPEADEHANRVKVLSALNDVPTAQRTARFRCAVALAAPDQETLVWEGACEGSIGYAARGTNGFGYDPIFMLADGRTMAELPAAEKNRISHRAKAYDAALPTLRSRLGLTEDAET